MLRRIWIGLWVLQDTARRMLGTFRRQRIGPAFLLGLVILLVAVTFSFLSFVPALSPFVYPLF